MLFLELWDDRLLGLSSGHVTHFPFFFKDSLGRQFRLLLATSKDQVVANEVHSTRDCAPLAEEETGPSKRNLLDFEHQERASIGEV